MHFLYNFSKRKKRFQKEEPMTIRILLVDDHTVVRKGLRTFLSFDSDLEVVAEAADGAQALNLARELTPDVALMALLMPWEAGYESAWVILTKLEPEEALVSWYGLRTWLEGGFKHFKRGLWGWHQSKMERASSVERLWLAMALAQLWCVSLGCQAEAQLEAEFRQNEPAASLPERHIAHRRRKRAVGQLPARRLSCVVRARLILLAMQSRSEPLAVGILRARPWPQTITAPQKQRTPSALKKKKTQKERRKRQKRRAREHARATG